MSTARVELSEEERAALRVEIQKRDGQRCFYCHRNFKRGPMRRRSFDHYIPYCMWRGWEVSNLVLACVGCNLAKGAALPWTVAVLLLRYVEQNPGWRLVDVPTDSLHTNDLEAAA
ncbi:HNH endonuclease [Streptomyces smyrnaeus]|uniref:HNH endonuclease n=1 Tax=Streptomyces smyrnaeus TaxID=1387713 RepID=UPI0033D297D1